MSRRSSEELERAYSVKIEETWAGTEVNVAKTSDNTLRVGMVCKSSSIIETFLGERKDEGIDLWRTLEDNVEILTFGIYPGISSKIPRPIDVVFYRLSEEPEDIEEELDSFRLFTDKLQYVLHKIVVASHETAEILAFALEIGGTFKRQNDLENINREAIELNKALVQRIHTVFQAFDRDNSGYLDIKEIEQVSAELGHSVSSDELALLFGEVDENADGQISLTEFTNWYKSGRLGSNKLLRNLTSSIASAKGLLKNAGKELNQLLGTESNYDEAINLHIIAHNRSVDSTGLKAELRVSAEKIDELEALAGEASVPEEHSAIIVSIKVASQGEDPEATTSREFSKLLSLISSFDPAIDTILQDSRLTVRTKGDRVYVILSVNLNEMRPFNGVLKEVSALVNACKFKQDLHVKGTWEISMEDLFEDERNVFENFIEDFNLEVTLKLWRRYRELLLTNRRLKRDFGFLNFINLQSGDIDAGIEGFASLPEFIYRKLRGSNSMKRLKIGTMKQLKKGLPQVLKTLETFSNIFEADFEVFARAGALSGFLKVIAPGLSSLIS